MRVLAAIYGPTAMLMAQAAIALAHPNAHVDLLLCPPSKQAIPTMAAIAEATPRLGRTVNMTIEESAGLHDAPPFLLRKELLPLARPFLRGRAVKRMRNLFEREYAAIYYPHDVTGASMIIPLLALAWPDAERICFGDGFGIFYAKKRVLSLLGFTCPPHPFLPETLPQRLIGALPTDMSGFLPEWTPLEIIPKAAFSETLRRANKANPWLRRALSAFLSPYEGQPKTLLLTENHAETGCISFESEIAMYREILLKHTPENAVVIIKPHPGETLPRSAAIQAALGNERRCVPLPDEYSVFPVELMDQLVISCDARLCCSYPRLTLAWLFGQDVINPMADPEFIHRWFKPDKWDSYENAITSYEEPLRLLPRWNGKSLLWSDRSMLREEPS